MKTKKVCLKVLVTMFMVATLTLVGLVVASAKPTTVILAIDRSGSMWGSTITDELKIDAAKFLAHHYIFEGYWVWPEPIWPDREKILSFGGWRPCEVTVEQGFTSYKHALHEAICPIKAGGGTPSLGRSIWGDKRACTWALSQSCNCLYRWNGHL